MDFSYKISVRKLQVVVLCIATALEAPYIREIFPRYYLLQLGVYVISAFLFLFEFFKTKLKLNKPFIILFLYVIYLGLLTVFNSGSLYLYINKMYLLLAFALVLVTIKTEEELLSVIKIWRILLLVLVIIDVFTMILFPHGLYRSVHEYETYTNCWFLGYKTNRLLYSLPLLFFDSYILIKCEEKIRFFRFLLYALLLFDVLYSKATMGSVIIVLFIAGLVSIYLVKPERLTKNIIYKCMMNYKLYAIVYAIIFITVVVLQNNTFIQNITTTYFGKSYDFNNRYPIWSRCVEVFLKNPVFGYGILESEDYLRITWFAVNPHNLLLSFLLTGGVLGLILVLLFIFASLKNAVVNKQNAIMIFGIYLVFLLGITSSTLVFSPYIFAIVILISLKELKLE
jgi:O-antigen ligase